MSSLKVCNSTRVFGDIGRRGDDVSFLPTKKYLKLISDMIHYLTLKSIYKITKIKRRLTFSNSNKKKNELVILYSSVSTLRLSAH